MWLIPKSDRFSLWPCLAGLFLTQVFLLIANIPGALGFTVAFTTIFWLPIIGIIFLGLIGYTCFKRRWKVAYSMAIVPLVIVVSFTTLRTGTPYVHLVLFLPYYEYELGTLPHNQPQFGAFDWSVGFAGGPLTFLIYDGSDEIILPPEKQPSSPVPGQGDYKLVCGGRSQHLLGHYYMCTMDGDTPPGQNGIIAIPTLGAL